MDNKKGWKESLICKEHFMLIEVIWEKKKHPFEMSYNNQFGIDLVALRFFFCWIILI